MKAILTVGIPASGKTSWAEEYCKQTGAKNINRDDLRMRIFELSDYRDYKFNKTNEEHVTMEQRKIIKSYAEAGRDIVISDTNLNKGRNQQLTNFLESLGYDVEEKLFPVDFFEAVKRDYNRRDRSPVGRAVIYRMYRAFMEYIEFEKYVPNTNKPPAYMFDVDGTIASMFDKNGQRLRSPFEFDKVFGDSVIEPVVSVLKELDRKNRIIIISARDDSCQDDTIKWLIKNEIPFDHIVMRDTGDKRPDREAKLDLFNNYIRDDYNIKGVFDDRLSVSLLWMDLGVPLFKVGDPILEF